MAKRRFSPAQLRAQRAFAARYGGKRRASTGGRRHAAKKATPMAHKTGRARRALSRGRSFGGRFKQPIDGILAAAATRAGAYLSPTYGPGLGMAAAGYYRHNEALTTLGVMSLAGAAIDSAKMPFVPAAPMGGYL